PHDPSLYAQRNIVERFFCEMKDMRRLATRFEKLGRNFMAMLHLLAIRCWIKCGHTLINSPAYHSSLLIISGQHFECAVQNHSAVYLDITINWSPFGVLSCDIAAPELLSDICPLGA
ncbi:Mobile element protein, partial [hydrothermal vent metagenome]